jgi:hypothetical protein
MTDSGIPADTAKIMWDRRAKGDLVADIGHDLGRTPLEVLDALREERRRREAAGIAGAAPADPQITSLGESAG